MTVNKLRLVPQLTLFAGVFLLVLSYATFGWFWTLNGASSYGNGISMFVIDNDVLFTGIGLICTSLLALRFAFKGNWLPSKNQLIDFMFVIGSFLFIAGGSIYNGFFFPSIVQLDTAYFFMFLGLGLFAASLFRWNNERRMKNRVGLSWEVISSGAISLTLIDLFILNFGGVGIPVSMLPLPAFFLLVISIVWLIVGIQGFRTARRSRPLLPQWSAPAPMKPLGNARISTAIILTLIAVMIFLALPVIPYDNGCTQGMKTPLSLVLNGFWVC